MIDPKGISAGIACLAALSFARVTPAPAQIRASERSVLSQTIDGTTITLDFARPRLRGRAPIFGKVVRWDEVWTPGANWATTLETNRPIQLDGHPVPKGKYSVWLVVRQEGAWTLVLDPDHHRYHMNPPDSSATQIRFGVTPAAAPNTEVLTWSFPDIRVSGGTMAMEWAGSRVVMDLKVEPSYGVVTPAEVAAPYVGRYTYAWKEKQGVAETWIELVITYENGSLYGTFVPRDGYFGRFVLIRLADGSLIPGIYDDKGEIYEVIREMVLEFKGPKDRPDVLEVRDDADDLIAHGARKPG